MSLDLYFFFTKGHIIITIIAITIITISIIYPHLRTCCLSWERGVGRETERGRENIDVREKNRSVATRVCPDLDGTHNLRMCADEESNLWPFILQNDALMNRTTLARV